MKLTLLFSLALLTACLSLGIQAEMRMKWRGGNHDRWREWRRAHTTTGVALSSETEGVQKDEGAEETEPAFSPAGTAVGVAGPQEDETAGNEPEKIGAMTGGQRPD